MASQFKHNYKEFSQDAIQRRVSQMIAFRNEVDVENAHVKFSYDNRKTGALVPSVSLIPVADCGNCKICSKGCYDVRNVCFQKTVQRSRANNSAIYEKDPERFMDEVEQKIRYLRFFRFFIGGDLKDYFMLDSIVGIAYRSPHCNILMFTKMHELVNKYIDDHGNDIIPDNLHIIFSGWKGDTNNNPHGLPVSSPIFPDGQQSCMVTGDAIWCTGDCSACAEINGGCWGLKKGQTVLFEAH